MADRKEIKGVSGMKNAVKAVITKAESKKLTFKFDGSHYDEVKQFIKLRKVGINSVVQLQIKDKESRSVKQNSTYWLLVDIAFKSRLFGESKEGLHNTLRYNFGKGPKGEPWISPTGQVITEWHSTTKYTMPEMAKLLKGVIDEMLIRFNENGYHSKRFDALMQEFNSEEIKPEPKEELEIF